MFVLEELMLRLPEDHSGAHSDLLNHPVLWASPQTPMMLPSDAPLGVTEN